jgi:hypothetical protein
MAFVVFHTETTLILRVIRQGFWQDATYKERGGATRALNAAAKAGKINPADYSILPLDEFAKIEKTKVVKNMMSGKDVTLSVNTPAYCDPSSEAYWSM